MANEVVLPSLDKSVQIGKAMFFTGSFWVANSMKAIAQVQGTIGLRHGTTFSDLRLEDQTGPMILDRILMGEDLSASAPLVMPFGAAAQTFLSAVSPTGKRTFGSDNPYKPPDTCVAIIPTFQVGGGLKFAQGAWTRQAGFGVTAALPSTVTVAVAGAAIGATTVPVAALTAAIPTGRRLVFLPGSNKTARLTAPAAIGATSLTVEALAVALVSADSAPVSHPDAIPYNGLFIFRSTLDYDALSYSTDAGGRMIPTITAQGMYSFQAGLPSDMKMGVFGDPMGDDLSAVPTTFFFSSP